MNYVVLLVLGVAVIYLVQRLQAVDRRQRRDNWVARQKLDDITTTVQAYTMYLEACPVNTFTDHVNTVASSVSVPQFRRVQRVQRVGRRCPRDDAVGEASSVAAVQLCHRSRERLRSHSPGHQ